MTREQFEAAAGPTGALTVGSPSTVAAKVVRALKGLGASRFAAAESRIANEEQGGVHQPVVWFLAGGGLCLARQNQCRPMARR